MKLKYILILTPLHMYFRISSEWLKILLWHGYEVGTVISLKIVNNLLSCKCIGIIYHIQKPIF